MEPIKTKRLIIRNFEDKDLDTLYAYRNDPDCARYQIWTLRSKPELAGFIAEAKKREIGDSWVQLAIEHNGQHIGDLYIAHRRTAFTLGYTIAKAYQRQGYAEEAVKAVIDYIFGHHQNCEILCLIHPKNVASLGLVTKLRFKSEGYEAKLESMVFSLTPKNGW